MPATFTSMRASSSRRVVASSPGSTTTASEAPRSERSTAGGILRTSLTRGLGPLVLRRLLGLLLQPPVPHHAVGHVHQRHEERAVQDRDQKPADQRTVPEHDDDEDEDADLPRNRASDAARPRRL